MSLLLPQNAADRKHRPSADHQGSGRAVYGRPGQDSARGETGERDSARQKVREKIPGGTLGQLSTIDAGRDRHAGWEKLRIGLGATRDS